MYITLECMCPKSNRQSHPLQLFRLSPWPLKTPLASHCFIDPAQLEPMQSGWKHYACLQHVKVRSTSSGVVGCVFVCVYTSRSSRWEGIHLYLCICQPPQKNRAAGGNIWTYVCPIIPDQPASSYFIYTHICAYCLCLSMEEGLCSWHHAKLRC